MKRARLIGMLYGTALAVALVSCASSDSTGPSGPNFKNGKTSNKGSSHGLAKCSMAVPALSVGLIGPQGGTVNIGKNALDIPAGALDSMLLISMEIAPDSTSSVIFQPEGLRFNVPATLTLDYKHCDVPTESQVAYTTDDLQILELLPSVDNKKKDEVSAQLQHFSRYAVAY